MLSFRGWVTEIKLLVVLNGLLLIAASVLMIEVLRQHRQTDINHEKLDTVKHQATLPKGETMTNRYRWQCELVRVIDGDTLQGWISLDFGVKLEARFRLEGIDTPEIHTVKQNTEEYKKGMLAKEFVEARFKVQGNKFWIETSGKRPGKYGRFVVNVLMPSGDYLGALLLKAGHAVKKEY